MITAMIVVAGTITIIMVIITMRLG